MSSGVKIYPLPTGQVAVMPIGAEEELERGATEQELRSVEGITAPSRRRERLAWRALLRMIVQKDNPTVEYLSSGRPLLRDSRYKYLSVSHCRDYVAVALSSEPCGVDVELLDRNFERVRSRYMSEQEASLGAGEHWGAVVWCAKEALFKMAGREGVDFLRDMQITQVEYAAEAAWNCTARLFDEQVPLRAELIDEKHLLVFTL